jgi:PAS domain S-box-containing protein
MNSHAALSNTNDAVLHAIVDNSFDSLIITEAAPNSPIIYVNKAFTELTGYSAEEALGKSPSFLQGPDTDPAVLERLRSDLAAGRVFEGKAINYRKDGSPFPMWWRVVPIMGEGGQPNRFIAFQREAPSA